MPSPTQGRMVLNTIDRTGKVLDLFTAETPEWGVTAVAAQAAAAEVDDLRHHVQSCSDRLCCNRLQATAIASAGVFCSSVVGS